MPRLKILRQILAPFRAHALVERLARARDDRERVAPVERLAGVDDHARVAAVGIAVVELLDRYREPESAAAGLVRPYALDLGDARRFQLVPDCAAAIGAEIER